MNSYGCDTNVLICRHVFRADPFVSPGEPKMKCIKYHFDFAAKLEFVKPVGVHAIPGTDRVKITWKPSSHDKSAWGPPRRRRPYMTIDLKELCYVMLVMES